MFDDIHAYFHENVLAAYSKYVRIKSSTQSKPRELLRATVGVASTLYHLREHMPDRFKKSRNELLQREPNYGLIGDIANVSKHRTIDRNDPRITKAENIFEAVVITEYQDDQGPYNHVAKSTFATLNDGTAVDLHIIIVSVLNMWLEEFEQAGIVDNVKSFPIYHERLPQRGESSSPNVSSIAGVRISQTFKFQKYNYTTDTIDAVDFTDRKVEGFIYQRQYNVTLKVMPKPGSDAAELNVDLILDGEQYDIMQKCKTDIQKMKLLTRIAQEQGKLPLSPR